MYAEHNEFFILVEALKDGYIEEGKSYSFIYDNKSITVNGNRLPEAEEQRYIKQIQEFYANGSREKAPTSWRMESDSLSVNEVLNPRSSFRDRGPWHNTTRKPSKTLIIEELARDRLIDTFKPFQINYTQMAVLVNGRSLSPAQEEKYRMLIRILEGFTPTKETDIYSIRR
jgi:hypothetical protein